MPPNKLVMRRMNVDLPHPESAARPMTTGPSRAARVGACARRAAVRAVVHRAVRDATVDCAAARRWVRRIEDADAADIVVVITLALLRVCGSIEIRWTCGDRQRSSRCVARVAVVDDDDDANDDDDAPCDRAR